MMIPTTTTRKRSLSLAIISALVTSTQAFLPPATPCRSSTILKAVAPSGLLTPQGKDLFDMTVEEVVEMHESAKRKRLQDALAEQDRRSQTRQASAQLAPFQELTQSAQWGALEAGAAAVGLILLHAAWSGEWSRNGIISYSTEQTIQLSSMVWAAERVVLAALAGLVSWFKEREVLPNVGRTLLAGALDFVRVALLDDKAAIEERALENQPPLAMEVSTLQMAKTASPTGVLLSTTIKALPGKDQAMRLLLTKLMEDLSPLKSSLVSTMAINQDPEERTTFVMLQRFPSMESMSDWQAQAQYQEFIGSARELLLQPLGLYVTNERKGKFTEPNYPFGPGGEGGRDDAIYSSPHSVGTQYDA